MHTRSPTLAYYQLSQGGLLGRQSRLPQTPTSAHARAALAPSAFALDADDDGALPYKGASSGPIPIARAAAPTHPAAGINSVASPAPTSVVVEVGAPEEHASLSRAVQLAGGLALQLGLVYFLEYVVCVGFSSLANPHSKDKDAEWLSRNSYEVLSACYQLGVLISRSSISFIVIDQVEYLTVGQFANWVLWLLQVCFYFIPLHALFPSMVVVGIFAGLAYVNVFYKAMRDTRLGVHKEKALNLLSLSANIGTIMSSVFTLVASKTFFKHKYD